MSMMATKTEVTMTDIKFTHKPSMDIFITSGMGNPIIDTIKWITRPPCNSPLRGNQAFYLCTNNVLQKPTA